MTWTTPPTEADWTTLVESLINAESVLLVAHVNPDADALGSSLAIARSLRTLGINAWVSFDEQPFRLPGNLQWLPADDVIVAPHEIPEQLDVVLSVDAASADRLGGLIERADSARLFAAIDHHRSHTGFAQLSIVDSDAPASAVLALELIDRLGVDLDESIASCLYAGLTADTGSFRYAGTTATTHHIAARLHDAGVAHSQIAERVFDTQPIAGLKLLAAALDRVQLHELTSGDITVISTWITAADRQEGDLGLDAAEAIIDVVRTAAESQVAVVLKQGDDSVWRVSTRSRGHVDVGELCSSLGGGGHRFAAGYSTTGEVDEVISELLTQLERSMTIPAPRADSPIGERVSESD